MGKIYAIANRKGGCAKTTTCGALASGITRLGCKVLVVDMDSQGNITDWAGVDASSLNTSYEVIMKKCDIRDAIVHTDYYDLLPADKSLANAETELISVQGREYRLRDALNEVKDEYDFVFIDTPPALSLTAILIFSAVDGGVIVTTDGGKFATKGMGDLAEALQSTREFYNPQAKVVGILLTRFNSRWNVMKTMREVTERFSEYFEAPLYDVYIRQSVAISEAQVDGIDIFDLKRSNAAVTDYSTFVQEFLVKEGYVNEA